MAALLAAGITYFFSKKLNTRRAQHSSTQIVATTTELPSGMTLGAKDVAVVDWPSDFPLQGSYTKVEGGIWHPLLFSLSPRGPGFKRHPAVGGSGIGLSRPIPPRMRAAAARPDGDVGVAGV